MKTLAFIAAGLLFTGTAYGQDGAQPAKPPAPVVGPAVPVRSDILSCHVAEHPQAICFWIDPAAQNCYTDALLPANPVGFPAIHPFNGGAPICWSGNRALLAIAKQQK